MIIVMINLLVFHHSVTYEAGTWGMLRTLRLEDSSFESSRIIDFEGTCDSSVSLDVAVNSLIHDIPEEVHVTQSQKRGVAVIIQIIIILGVAY